jgi:hypothetical protein
VVSAPRTDGVLFTVEVACAGCGHTEDVSNLPTTVWRLFADWEKGRGYKQVNVKQVAAACLSHVNGSDYAKYNALSGQMAVSETTFSHLAVDGVFPHASEKADAYCKKLAAKKEAVDISVDMGWSNREHAQHGVLVALHGRLPVAQIVISKPRYCLNKDGIRTVKVRSDYNGTSNAMEPLGHKRMHTKLAYNGLWPYVRRMCMDRDGGVMRLYQATNKELLAEQAAAEEKKAGEGKEAATVATKRTRKRKQEESISAPTHSFEVDVSNIGLRCGYAFVM